MMVVLLGATGDEFSLRPGHVYELAKLGVTNVALLRDEQMVGIVLEGWSFDPARSARAAADAVGANGARTLHPVLQMAVSARASEGGRDVRDISHARA
jgi:hypothetical protein